MIVPKTKTLNTKSRVALMFAETKAIVL